MSDQALEKAKADHKLAGVYNGADDLLMHEKIVSARPRGAEVVEHFRGKKGCVVEERGSKFTLTLEPGEEGLKRKREWFEMSNPARRLSADRGALVRSKDERVEAVNPHGQRVQVSVANERQLARRGLISSLRKTFLAVAGMPRCRRVEPEQHDYRNGRCWWCGQREPRDG